MGNPIDASGCSGCPTCLSNGDKQPVPVPKCYRQQIFCVTKKCRIGEVLRVVKKAGTEGQAPCCPVVECKAAGNQYAEELAEELLQANGEEGPPTLFSRWL